MQKYLKAKVLLIFTLLFTIQANGQSFTWHNPLQESNYVVNGRGWNEELKSNYARLPLSVLKQLLRLKFGIFRVTQQD